MAMPPEPPAEPPPPAPPSPDMEGGECPRCGAAYEPFQEYCLECGLRLPVARGIIPVLATAWRRRISWYPGDWIWPVLLALVIAALAAAIAYSILVTTLVRANGPDSAVAAAVRVDVKGYVSLALYASGVVLSFVSPWIAYALYGAVAVIWFVPDRRFFRSYRNVA